MKNIKLISSLFTGNSLTVTFLDGKNTATKIAQSSHINWNALVKAYKAQAWSKVVHLIDVAGAINSRFNGKFTVKNGAVYHGDQPVHGYLFSKILDHFNGGLPYKNLLNFAEKLYQNPSERARNELYKFLELRNYTITPDGDVIGWKGVLNDYYSSHGGDKAKIVKGKVNNAGQIYNGVGETIEMKRQDVDDNANNTCSFGLHIASRAFATDFVNNGRLMVVKFSPSDAVSVTSDAQSQKLRVCKYTVIGEETDKVNKEDCSAKAYVKKSNSKPKRDANGRFC
jgi:hypothetical protein